MYDSESAAAESAGWPSLKLNAADASSQCLSAAGGPGQPSVFILLPFRVMTCPVSISQSLMFLSFSSPPSPPPATTSQQHSTMAPSKRGGLESTSRHPLAPSTRYHARSARQEHTGSFGPKHDGASTGSPLALPAQHARSTRCRPASPPAPRRLRLSMAARRPADVRAGWAARDDLPAPTDQRRREGERERGPSR